jgi:hypothetical protein
VELSLSRNVSSYAAVQEFLNTVRNPKVHYHVHTSPPLAPILSQINPVHNTHTISLRSILISVPYTRLDLLNGLFPFGLPTKLLYEFLLFPYELHILCLLDFMILIVLGDEYKLQSSSICGLSNFVSLHPSSVQAFPL